MKTTLLLLPIILISIPISAVADEELSLHPKEAAAVSELMKEIFDGWMVDDRAKALDAKNELVKKIEAIEKEKGVEDLLRETEFWYRIREGAIDKENKILKKHSTI